MTGPDRAQRTRVQTSRNGDSMTPTPPRPGAEIDAWCTKCRMNLLHRIIAVDKGQIARVECRTCGGHHNYRRQRTDLGKAAPAPRTRAPSLVSGPSARAAAAAESERQRASAWRQAVFGKPDDSFTPYRATETFARGDLIRHGKFGDGYIVQVTDRQKVEAMFKDGPRTLAQAIEG
jgi:hypothetical protein